MASVQSVPFDFHLSSAQEERAARLHRDSIIIDMLYQGPVTSSAYTDEMSATILAEFERTRSVDRATGLSRALPAQMAARGEFSAFKEWWDASGVTAGNRQLGDLSAADVLQTMAEATVQFDRLPWLIKATSGEDIRRAKAEGKHAGFVTAQETVGIGLDLDNLDRLHDFGLNMCQLTYNTMNLVGAGCVDRSNAGISSFGVKLVERMNRLGIIVDTGHCGRQTTLDACQISRTPVIASHTCVKAISGHIRGKDDEQLKAIAGTGGVVGIVMVPSFLDKGPDVTIEHFLDHIDYVSRLVGHKHVGIGTDWPMNLCKWSVEVLCGPVAATLGYPLTADTVRGFADYRDFANITRGLVSRGYSDDQVRDILGGNWLRVIDLVWK